VFRRIESSPMGFEDRKLVLWTGKKHSGKTTGAARLVRAVRAKGYVVGGLVAPAVYRDGALIGFDAVDLRSGQRAALARDNGKGSTAGRFEFLAEGLRLGNASLSPAATASADLVVVDEFGPLELNQQGWRRSVDLLAQSSEAIILLVVREELADEVERLYGDIESVRLCTDDPEAVRTAISILEGRREHARQHNATT
jgi:nucleoside-triphosphatase THEP1